MANWSGTKTITAGTTGTATAATANTLTNSSANWPTTNGLANYTIRILTGTGAGQERTISSNTATQVTVSSNWTQTPSTDSTYEIVLLIKDGDHLTGTLALRDNVTCEIQDSATLYVDGNYNIQLDPTAPATTTFKWEKSESTLVTVEFNNRSLVGTRGSWGYIYIFSCGVVPKISYVRRRDGGEISYYINQIGDGSTIHHCVLQNNAGANLNINGGTGLPGSNITLRSFLGLSNAGGVHVIGYQSDVAVVQEIFDCWSDERSTGSHVTGGIAQGNSHIHDVVSHSAGSTSITGSQGAYPGRTQIVRDVYFVAQAAAIGWPFAGFGYAASGGMVYCHGNTSFGTGVLCQTGSGSPKTSLYASSNDGIGKAPGTTRAIDYTASTYMLVAASDHDYIAGTNGAVPENADTTNATTSTASPNQYRNLTTPRTNARNTRNKPLVCDNVIVSGIGQNGATITFDSASGAIPTQGSTVDQDSASGGTTLYVAATSMFLPGMLLDIGYGTARWEQRRIASIAAGDSVTLDSALTYTHTASDADPVKISLRHRALGFVRYGTSSGVYVQESYVAPKDDWGWLWTGIRTTSAGNACSFKTVGHSVTLANLKPGTTYYAQACGYPPTGELMTSSEFTFTTTAAPSGAGGPPRAFDVGFD